MHQETLKAQHIAYRRSLAGSGTIANALIVILYNLVQNPSAYHTLVKEIDKYYLDNPGSEKHLSWDVQNLPYLWARPSLSPDMRDIDTCLGKQWSKNHFGSFLLLTFCSSVLPQKKAVPC